MKKIVTFLKKQNIYVLFTIFFFLFLLIGLLPLEISNGSILFGGFFKDGFKQHMVFMQKYITDIKNFFSTGVFPQFSFQQGLGDDFIYSYTYYGLFDPFNIIAYLIPISNLDFSYNLIIHVKLYLAGIFFIIVLKRMGIKKKSSLFISSLFYTFSSLMLFTAFRHLMFLTPFILVPLLILGCQKIYNKESPYLLILVAFVSFISHYYMTFYLLFALELFCITNLIIKSKQTSFKKAIKDFLLINLAFGVGIGIASFILFSQINALIECGRISSKGLASIDMASFFETTRSFVAPISGSHYTVSIGNVVALFLVGLYLPKNYKKPESIFVIFISIAIFIYPIGYLLNLGSYANNRYSFIMGFFIAYIIAMVFEKWETYEKKDFTFAIKLVLCFLVFLLASLVISLSEDLSIAWYVVIALIVISLAFLALYKIVFLKSSFPFTKFLQNKKIMGFAMLCCTFITVLAVGNYYISVTSKGDVYQNFNKPSDYGTIYEDKDFFRVSESLYYGDLLRQSNDNIINGYNATYTYNTLTNKNSMEIFNYFDVLNTNNTVGYNNFDNRLYLNNISSVKYIMVKESEKRAVPFGFSECETLTLKKCDTFGNRHTNNDEYETVTVYKNDNFINFGFVYHQYSLKKELRSLESISVETSLLDSVILEEDVNLEKNTNITSLSYRAANFTNFHGVTKTFEKYNVFEDTGTISFEIPAVNSAEVILQITNISNYDDVSFKTTYETIAHKSYNNNFKYGHMFYYDNSDHTVNLGYYEDITNLQVNITLPKGTYRIDDIGYYLRPINATQIIEKTAELNDESLNNLKFSTNQFTGDISLKEDGLLFVSIPYHNGFKAYANGKEVKILRANIGYMGLLLEKGDYEIKFVYETPGLKPSIYVSISFAFIGALWVILDKVYRNSKQKEQ